MVDKTHREQERSTHTLSHTVQNKRDKKRRSRRLEEEHVTLSEWWQSTFIRRQRKVDGKRERERNKIATHREGKSRIVAETDWEMALKGISERAKETVDKKEAD